MPSPHLLLLLHRPLLLLGHLPVLIRRCRLVLLLVVVKVPAWLQRLLG